MKAPQKTHIFGALFSITGLVFVLLAVVAPWIGLDYDTGWGPSRITLLLLGSVLVTWSWGSRYREQIFRWPIIQKSAIFLRRLTGSAALSLALAGLVVVGVCFFGLWYVSAGLFPKFPPVDNAYIEQGEVFLHGQAALLVQPSQELMALANPYDPEQRAQVPYIWDLSYYRGRYYLYWGPVPTLVAAGWQAVIRTHIPEGLLVWIAYAGLVVVIFGLLVTLWRQGFSGAPGASVGLFLAAALLNLPFFFAWPPAGLRNRDYLWAVVPDAGAACLGRLFIEA